MSTGRQANKGSIHFVSPERELPVNVRRERKLDPFEVGRRLDIIRIVIAIFLPPVAVFTQVGLGKHFWINCLLTLLGWLPGVVHALYVIGKY